MTKHFDSQSDMVRAMLALAHGLFLFMCGLGISGVAIWILLPPEVLREENFGEKNLASFLLVLISLPMLLIGIYGAYIRHPKSLILFASIMTITSIMLGAVIYDDLTIRSVEMTNLIASMVGKGTIYNWYKNRTNHAWDNIQTRYECCGLDDPTDMLDQLGYSYSSQELPGSCCSSVSLSHSLNDRCTLGRAFKNGCLAAWVARENSTMWVNMAGFALNAIMVSLALVLAKFDKNTTSAGRPNSIGLA